MTFLQSTVPKKMVTGTLFYPQFLADKNHKIAHKNTEKSFINFKPRIANVAITGMNFAPPKYDFMCNWPCYVRKELW